MLLYVGAACGWNRIGILIKRPQRRWISPASALIQHQIIAAPFFIEKMTSLDIAKIAADMRH